MSDLPTLVDVSGLGDAGPVRWKMVRLIQSELGWDAYGERRNGRDTEVVHMGTLPAGDLEPDPVKRQRWTLGGYRVTEHRGCGCGGRGAALKRWEPPAP